MRALIIEDELQLKEQLAERLGQAGFAVDSSDNGEEGRYLGNEYDYDIAVVDVGLPGISGLEVIQAWRDGQRRFPVIILTARGRWQEKVEGLEAGADDYLVKPFHMEELLARVRALVRRSAGIAQPRIQAGPLCLDPSSQTVTLDGQPVELTAFEYRILAYLMLHPGEVISKATLTEHLYDQDFDRDSNVLEVLIGRLRRKLDPDNRLKPIETLRGRGYRFALGER